MVSNDAQAWREAARLAEVQEAVSRIHDRLAEEVRLRKPLCLASGACCHFDAFEHRLYATGLEAALCVNACEEEGRAIGAVEVEAARKAGGCPWQEGRLCMARSGRPVGCRVFYCDPRASEWVPELAEWAHGAIRRLHEDLQVPYAYGEWREMLELVVFKQEK